MKYKEPIIERDANAEEASVLRALGRPVKGVGVPEIKYFVRRKK